MGIEADYILEAVANQIRSAYLVERSAISHTGRPYRSSPKWDGGVDKYGKRHKPIWPKIAKLVLSNHLDPLAFVRAQFSGRTHNPPRPTELLNAKALDRAGRAKACDTQDFTVFFRSQINTYCVEVIRLNELMEWPKELIWLTVLKDESLSLSSLFRYCQAVAIGGPRFEKVARKYRVAAMLQYIRGREEYDRVWKDWLSPEFKAECQKLGEDLGLLLEEDTCQQHQK